MKTYLRILSYARPIKLILPVYILLVILESLFNVASASSIAPLLEMLFKQTVETKETLTFPHFELSISYFEQLFEYVKYYVAHSGSKTEVLTRICILIVVIMGLQNLFTYLGSLLLAVIKSRVIIKLRKELYEKLTELQLGYYSDEKKGNIISKMTTDAQEVEGVCTNTFNTVIKGPIKIIAFYTTLFIISTELTLFTLWVLPITGIIVGLITRKLRQSTKIGQQYLGDILSVSDETIGGLKIIKGFNAINFVRKSFNKINLNYGKIVFKMDAQRELSSPTSMVLGSITLALILLKGGTIILNGDSNSGLTAETFFVYLIVYIQLLDPIKALSRVITYIQRGLVSGERIFEVIDTETTIVDKPNAKKLETFESKISLKNVDFSYGEKTIINNLNLIINKGETIALVGPSGGGKSTLIDLIPRFHEAKAGSISIDGTNVEDYTMHSLRDKMGIVTQEAILFNDTIHNNIAFGLNVTRKDVVEAARVANADEFIVGLDNGYDTNIGDRGMKLSGGQRQRITIARAVLKNPPILLLDEATSALDSESEKLVQHALNSLMKNRTSIIIAHRLSTIQNADKIVVIKDGKIEEEGTHESLLIKKGLYSKLQEIQ